MNNIIDRQTLIFSIDLLALNPSLVKAAAVLRFAADALILKSIAYNDNVGTDVDDIVQIWCSITQDGLIGAFANNASVNVQHDELFLLSNTFQFGVIEFQFQQTRTNVGPVFNNPQPLISEAANVNTDGCVVLTIEFIKYAK